MTDHHKTPTEDKPDLATAIKYWATVIAGVFAVLFLLLMMAFGTYLGRDCDFVEFITFQCF